jgi:hypothetical protein
MKAFIVPPRSGTRFGRRLRLALELGLLIAILAAVLVITQTGKAQIRTLVDQNLADRQLSHFATEIVVQALLCRRYEKDMLLNLSDQVARSNYLTRWYQAVSDLERAIQSFGEVAVTAADRAQADVWRTESTNYRAAVLQMVQAVDRGSTLTPQEANTMLVPAKDAIRHVTDTAVIAARDKETAVGLSSGALSSAISGNARMIVLFGLVGLILCSVLYRR